MFTLYILLLLETTLTNNLSLNEIEKLCCNENLIGNTAKEPVKLTKTLWL